MRFKKSTRGMPHLLQRLDLSARAGREPAPELMPRLAHEELEESHGIAESRIPWTNTRWDGNHYLPSCGVLDGSGMPSLRWLIRSGSCGQAP